MMTFCRQANQDCKRDAATISYWSQVIDMSFLKKGELYHSFTAREDMKQIFYLDRHSAPRLTHITHQDRRIHLKVHKQFLLPPSIDYIPTVSLKFD
jgi:hypothetical protein